MQNLSKEIIKNLLDFDFDVRVYDTATSTNDLARENAPAVVFARVQTNGRGRMGREFYSGEGGLYFSISLKSSDGAITVFDKTIPFLPSALTISAGIAVCKALIKFGYDASIKWVNDVFVAGKKVCGILAEGTPDKAIVGIGVNFASYIPASLSDKAISLMSKGDINELAADIINTFCAEMLKPDIEFLNSHCFTLGKSVRTKEGVGIAKRVNPNGSLIVAVNGAERQVYYGEAEILP